MSEGLDRHMDDTLLRATMEEARAEVRRGQETEVFATPEKALASGTPAMVIGREEFDESLADPEVQEQIARAERLGEEDALTGKPGDGDGFVGMGPGVDYSSETRDF